MKFPCQIPCPGRLAVIYGGAALALIVVSIGALFASRYVARTQALEDAERMTARLAELQLGPLLTPALKGSSERSAELDRATRIRMDDGYLTEIAVWNATRSAAATTPRPR